MSSLLELLKSKKAQLASGRRAKTLKPTDGTTRWRILPGWRKPEAENSDQFWHDFGNHFIKDQAGELKAVYICVDKTFGKPCAVCSTIAAAIKGTSDDVMVELLSEARATGRILVNALALGSENPTEPGILELPPTVFESFLNIVGEWGPEVLDLATGKDIVIERSGKGKNTKYSVQVAAKSQPVPPSVMAKIANLDEYVAQESEENALRALTNFRQVAGLLPAGVGTGVAVAAPATPRSTMSTMMVEDDVPVAAAVAATPAAVAAAVAAVPLAASPVAPAPAVVVAAAAAPAATGDAELDALLAELG